MMKLKAMEMSESSDASLVTESLTGNREAFGRIVGRYQTLICSLAYSGTGSLSQSEDLAQETFIAAWRQLANLREPQKLRSWLCGIARNLIYDAIKEQARKPRIEAELLSKPGEPGGRLVESGGRLEELQDKEPLPDDFAIKKEEETILWRAVERIPEIYREPLVLFYREHQSVEAVARNLELSEDAVKQRLSRGRKLLHEEVLAFVEGALARTNPGKVFTMGVLAALPALTISAKAATIGATAAKGGVAMKSAGAMGLVATLFGPLLIVFGNFIPYRMALAEAHSTEERGYIKSFFRRILVSSLGLSAAFMAMLYLAFWNEYSGRFSGWELFRTWFFGFVVIYLLVVFTATITTVRRRRAYYSRILAAEYGGIFPKPAWEYCSKLKLLGLPLVHIRIGDRFDLLKGPVRAWIAVGYFALGGLFAFGGLAVAPFSIGGLAIGLAPLGGLAFGLAPLGGLAAGVWAFGAIAIGWQAIGACAIGWSAAVGKFAWAHDFALGDIVHAAQMNNDIARDFAESNWFFRYVAVINRHWFWTNLLWIAPLFVQWRVIARSRRNEPGNR